MNSVNISGRLTKDAEIRDSASCTILRFSMCWNDRVKKDGEWTDKPNYFDVVLFDPSGKRANALAPRLTKGATVAVQGKLRQSQFTTKDGESKKAIEIMADDIVTFAEAKKKAEPVESYYEEDIPF